MISFVPSDFGKCGPGQIAHGSYCYEFNSNEVSWNSALRDCQSKNGDLASIHSTVEQAFMAMNIRKVNKDMWIGKAMFVVVLLFWFFTLRFVLLCAKYSYLGGGKLLLRNVMYSNYFFRYFPLKPTLI